MLSNEDLLISVYRAFNARDLDGALALMSEDVDWPKASEGGRVTGKAAVRAYWTRQWAAFDPHVDPLRQTEGPDGRIHVRVHQVIRDPAGSVLADSEVEHLFTLANGLVQRMDLAVADSWHLNHTQTATSAA